MRINFYNNLFSIFSYINHFLSKAASKFNWQRVLRVITVVPFLHIAYFMIARCNSCPHSVIPFVAQWTLNHLSRKLEDMRPLTTFRILTIIIIKFHEFCKFPSNSRKLADSFRLTIRLRYSLPMHLLRKR